MQHPAIPAFGAALLTLLAPAHPAAGEGGRTPPPGYVVLDAGSIPDSLTGRSGDPARGARLFARAGCAACHDGAVPGDHLSRGEIRLWIVAPGIVAPAMADHGVYRPGQRTDPDDPAWGGPLLDADAVEDLVAYLSRARTD
jgi:mono/diheme cytochrome c family protein